MTIDKKQQWRHAETGEAYIVAEVSGSEVFAISETGTWRGWKGQFAQEFVRIEPPKKSIVESGQIWQRMRDGVRFVVEPVMKDGRIYLTSLLDETERIGVTLDNLAENFVEVEVKW